MVSVLTGALLVAAGTARAGDECKEIELTGSAGGSSATLEIRVVDARPSDLVTPMVTNSDILSQSCAITVPPGITAADLIRRIPQFWRGTPDAPDNDPPCNTHCVAPPASVGTACAVDSDCDQMLGDGVCGTKPKALCGNDANVSPSCKIESRVTQVKGKCLGGGQINKPCLTNSDCPGSICPGADTVDSCVGVLPNHTCAKKRTLRICCRATPGCSGPKLGGGANIPITVQTRITGTAALTGCTVGNWCPADAVIPDTNMLRVGFKQDPIDGRPGPYESERVCRAALQPAAAAVTNAAYGALEHCYGRVMNGDLPAGACDDADAVVTADAGFTSASASLQSAATSACQSSGRSPSDFGYAACPAPCESIAVGTCVAGQVGQPCARNRNCDVAAGDGTGVCGQWSTQAACSICVAKSAAIAAAHAAYGEVGLDPTAFAALSGRSITDNARRCQTAIGDEVGSILAVDLKDTAKCQKSIDAFKLLLPNRTPRCKDADPKGKRARARGAAQETLTVDCDNAALAQLDTCASNLAGLLDCVPKVAGAAAAATADGATPDGRCGDGQDNIGEKCDDGNAVDGDGCDSNCTPTGCGNGIVTAGEECDDGNVTSGDGCSPTCIAEPQTCGPQMCGQYTYDCNAGLPGACICARNAEGGGSCVSNFSCASAVICNTSSQCAPNERCLLDTCCGPPGTGICGPATCKAP